MLSLWRCELTALDAAYQCSESSVIPLDYPDIPYCNWMIKKLDGQMPFEYSRLHWSRLCRLPRFASCKSQFEFCLKIQYFQIWSVFECCKNASHVIILRKVYNGSTKIFRGNFRFQNFCFKRDSKMLLYFTF